MKKAFTSLLTVFRGQAWQLLEVGSYSLQVTAEGFKPVYKAVKINQGKN